MSNKKLFWERICDIQEGIGVKNMFDLVRKEVHVIFRTKNRTKGQIRKHKRRTKELDSNSTATFAYVRSDILSRIIKNSRGENRNCENKRQFQV